MRKVCLVVCVCVLAVGSWFVQIASGADFKPVELDPSYNHVKYAPIPPLDGNIVTHFRAYTTCFDGADDDNGDGTPDQWAIPHWVAYEIKSYDGELGKYNRPSPWITVKELYAEVIAPKDESYRFSKKFREENPDSPQLGYDRGHMCMKHHASRLGENADWNTHTVLNACPQRSKLNQGIWLDLEKKTAGWADNFGSVWIITGPVVYNNTPSKWLGEEGEVPVAIPDTFFKIVVREEGNLVKVLAFLYPQEGIAYKESPYDHTPYLTTVDIIEALTGLDFFPNLDDNVEMDIERILPIQLWD